MGFINPEPSKKCFRTVRDWRKSQKAQKLPKPPENGYEAFINQWWEKADFNGQEDAIWWLGHACILIRTQGTHILIDPALSQRASPLSFFGPKRKTPPAATVEELPKIDVLIYSHNHYDHLDSTTLKKLLKRFPSIKTFVPLGVGKILRQYGAGSVSECDWWDEVSMMGLKLHCTPARHWSMRSLWDFNRSLWCSWVIDTGTFRFFFAGDTGYTLRLVEIGERLGPFDVAALPIGAYMPEWFMEENHMSPESAVRLYQQLLCPSRVIPIHWGTYELSDESLDEPPQELVRAREKAGITDDHFAPLKIGSRIIIENVS
ncbi:hypothetical protein B488_08140 [Liberibacter crescens BT-1]|uniref:Metallo-beta-lactamase domain-containing protein n=1 Tax=Liberibacter crescens (strain BT-1) TaxID=1215343 RepID=L0EWP8_LIBCB|nr:MBL fold metallo-hydrolase [Liberibacter crescens]AGA64806.1 hypothetical protein B488_08140 [Liberibacter crescens BT-1]